MEYLRIKNWEKHQHYTKRKPPWIKLYFSILMEPKFLELSDASKLHTIASMLLASQHDNKIPFKKSWIARAIGASNRINWDEVLSSGMIECYQDASTPLASCQQSAMLETETETYTYTPISPQGDLAGGASRSVPEAVAEAIEMIPCKGNGIGWFSVTQAMVVEFQRNYPALDVEQELRGMRAWSVANPSHQKTARGMMRFVNSWLSRAQDKAGKPKQGVIAMALPRTLEEIYGTDEET